MLNGKFIVTFQDDAVFVLDPLNGITVGAAVLNSGIKSISTSGGFLYILCGKAIVRVVVHHSLITTYKKPLLSNQSTPCVSVTSSPMGSIENLLKRTDDVGRGEKEFDQEKGVDNLVPAATAINQITPVVSIAVSDSDGFNLSDSTEKDVLGSKGIHKDLHC